MNAAELAHALGGKRAGRQWSCRCPAHSDGDPSLIIYDGREAVQVRCLSGCDSRDVIAALRARGLWNGEPRRRLTKEERKALREQARERAKREAAARAAATAQALRIWDDARPALGTAVEYIYLSLWRGMDFDVVDVSEGADAGMVAGVGESVVEGVSVATHGQIGTTTAWRQWWARLLVDTIRFHPRCPREHDRQPAMLCLMRSMATGAPQAIHRTFLTPRWDKDGVPMMLGPAAGSAIMLAGSLPGGPCRQLWIAEGVESGLGVVWHGLDPVAPGVALWALGSTSLFKSFQPVPGVEECVVCADDDPPGRYAAGFVVARWRYAGKRAQALQIDQRGGGADFASDLRL